MTKRDLMVVDLIANNNWERPIYFSITVGNSPKAYFWLNDYFRLEGMAYRFVPVKYESGTGIDYGKVDTDIMYENLMSKFSYGNMELPEVYLDETNRRLSYNLRTIFGRLANELIVEGENEKAIEVLDFAMDKMPAEKFGYNYFVFGIIDSYYKAGATDKARELTNAFANHLDAELDYFSAFDRENRKRAANEWRTNLQFYQMLLQNVQVHDQDSVQDFYQRFQLAAQPFGNGRG
jgi:tetratricopeptide (TPR) repeat protein